MTSRSSGSPIARETIIAAQKGNKEAQNRLFETYYSVCLNRCRKKIKCHQDAEDIAVEAFLGFLKYLPNIDLKKGIEGALLSITDYKIIDYFRHENRSQKHTYTNNEQLDEEINRRNPDHLPLEIKEEFDKACVAIKKLE